MAMSGHISMCVCGALVQVPLLQGDFQSHQIDRSGLIDS